MSAWGGRALLLVAGGWLALIWAWWPAYLTLTVDDAFYYFQIARNVGDGLGPTFDGVTPTNGFHPLWLAVLTPIASLSGNELPVRLALSAQLVMVVVAVRLLARRLGDPMRMLEGVTAFALLSSYATKTLVNGTEAALQLLLLAVATAAFASAQGRPTKRSAAWLGALAALVALSRLDAVVFGVTLVAMPVIWPVPSDGHATRRWRQVGVGAAALAGPLAVVAATSWLWFGHPLPVSAAIKAEWIRRAASPLSVVAAVGALVVVAGGYRLLAPRFGGDASRAGRALFPLVAYAATVVAVHGIVPRRLIFEIWYLPPVVAVGLVAAACVVAAAWGQRRRPALQLLVAAGVAVYALVGAWSWLYRLQPASYAAYEGARRAGLWVRSNVAEEAMVAGWDCGIAAWHAGRGFVHLEGLVSSWQFKWGVLDEGRLEEHLAEAGIDYLVQPFSAPALARRPQGATTLLDGWFVARAECVDYRSMAAPGRALQRVYMVLSREETGPTFGDFGASVAALCAGAERIFVHGEREGSGGKRNRRPVEAFP